MSATQTPPTPRERLDSLVEQSLAAAEARAAEGHPPSARELNGLRRLLGAQESDEQLRQLNALARGAD